MNNKRVLLEQLRGTTMYKVVYKVSIDEDTITVSRSERVPWQVGVPWLHYPVAELSECAP